MKWNAREMTGISEPEAVVAVAAIVVAIVVFVVGGRKQKPQRERRGGFSCQSAAKWKSLAGVTDIPKRKRRKWRVVLLYSF